MLMGFPVGYSSEVPRVLLHLLFLLSHLRRICSWLLRLTGLDHEYSYSPAVVNYYYYGDDHDEAEADAAAASHRRMEEHSPAVRFDSLTSSAGGAAGLPEGCAVCLGDFHGAAEVRRARGCRHVFHRACLDRWAAHGTCPLCRAPLLPPPEVSPVLLPLPVVPAPYS